MIIYNQNILRFKKRLETEAKNILANECGLKVGRSRFHYKKYTYPINIVVFEHPVQLGYFKPKELTIGINSELILNSFNKNVRDILRHELAHYLSYIEIGTNETPHGMHFKNLCRQFGWEEDVFTAKTNLTLLEQNQTGDLKTQALMEKVKKLLKLGSSSESHEAKLATQKANELLLKYNLKLTASEDMDTLTYYQKGVLTQKARSVKMETIYDIVSQFFVKPVFSYFKGGVRLDLFGTKANIEFAEYVVNFLDYELDRLWLHTKKEFNYKGVRPKNSFFKGIAKGFINSDKDVLKEAALINKEIDYRYAHYIGGGRLSASSAQIDAKALSQGKKTGQTLTINPAINNKAKTLYLG